MEGAQATSRTQSWWPSSAVSSKYVPASGLFYVNTYVERGRRELGEGGEGEPITPDLNLVVRATSDEPPQGRLGWRSLDKTCRLCCRRPGNRVTPNDVCGE